MVDVLLDCPRTAFSRFHALSLKALRQIVPYMETGSRYDKACQRAGYHHSQLHKAGVAVVPDRSAKWLCGFVEGAVAPGTKIVTDDWNGFAGLTKRGYDHLAVAECGDPQIADEYLPIIHLVFANLKTWLMGTHHGVSHQHLKTYLNEFTFRFNRRFYPFNAFRSLLGIAGGVAAPTYAELYSGDWNHRSCLKMRVTTG